MSMLISCLLAVVISQDSNSWKGFERTAIQYDASTDTFKGADLAGIAASMAMEERMELTDSVLDEAGETCRRVTAEAEVLASAEASRPVVLITADYDIVDALDRKNLTLVIPEWSFDAVSRNVTARVFTTSILKSPPICEARISTALDGLVARVPCEWHGYGVSSSAKMIQVGNDPENTFECYELTFVLPPEVNEMSVDMTKWGRIGDPEVGFNVGNRQIRVNGELAKTTTAVDEIKSIFSFGTVHRVEEDGSLTSLDEFEFFTDNGLTKATLKEMEE